MNIPTPVRLDERYQNLLLDVTSQEDIPTGWRGTPIESIIMAQNFGWPIQATGGPELLIATCIEFRYALPVPRMYAYVIRRASGRVIGSEFSVGYTLAQGVKFLAIIGHNDCGMSKVHDKAPDVVNAFVDQGWRRELAEEYVRKHAARHAISDELLALREEYIRLRNIFPKLVIAPLFVCLHDCRFYIPRWYQDVEKDVTSVDLFVADELVCNLP